MATLPAVTGLVATTYLYSAVTLAWRAVPGAVSYQTQYKKRVTKSWTNGPLVKAPTTNTNLTGLDAGASYDFRVYANGV